MMFFIKAKVVKLLDNSNYPEIVCCEFCDVYGVKHKIIEKLPVVSAETFSNTFPCDCIIACTIVEEHDNYFIVDTGEPWAIESVDSKHIFNIGKELLTMGE